VDRLANPLHHRTAYNYQTRGHDFVLGTALSHRAAVGDGTFLGDAMPPVLDIQWSFEHLGTYVTESYME
jgi:hypothetical protein